MALSISPHERNRPAGGATSGRKVILSFPDAHFLRRRVLTRAPPVLVAALAPNPAPTVWPRKGDLLTGRRCSLWAGVLPVPMAQPVAIRRPLLGTQNPCEGRSCESGPGRKGGRGALAGSRFGKRNACVALDGTAPSAGRVDSGACYVFAGRAAARRVSRSQADLLWPDRWIAPSTSRASSGVRRREKYFARALLLGTLGLPILGCFIVPDGVPQKGA
jgi:hypothetical protein